MKVIEVDAERRYLVKIDVSWMSELSQAIAGRRQVAVVVSNEMSDRIRAELASLSVPDIALHLLEIADGEDGKSAPSLISLWEELSDLGLTRDDLLVGIGGGAVTDLTGFLAATWLRGIDWIAVPTTMAGMVDAAIGGKTGINLPSGKNLVGAFHSPVEVLIDLSWLATLPDRDFSAGLAEVVKCGFISDSSILSSLTEIRTLHELKAEREVILDLIGKAVLVKANIVSADFTESSLRELLNYGHTFGHAIELESGFSLRHGECVSIGMVFVAELAFSRKLISQDLLDSHRRILQSLNLPTSLPTSFSASDLSSLIGIMMGDKKARAGKIRFVLLSSDQGTVRVDDVTSEEIAAAYEKVLA